MKRIPLSAHKPYGRAPRAYALVDDEDYGWLLELCPWWQVSMVPPDYPRATGEIGGVRQKMSRVLLGVLPGDRRHVDHIDGNTLNNQRKNLRICTCAENLQNQRARSPKQTSSRFRNVTWNPLSRKWRVDAMVAGTRHYLGLFDDELEAAKAAQAFRDEHMPFAMPDPVLVAALTDHEPDGAEAA